MNTLNPRELFEAGIFFFFDALRGHLRCSATLAVNRYLYTVAVGEQAALIHNLQRGIDVAPVSKPV